MRSGSEAEGPAVPSTLHRGLRKKTSPLQHANNFFAAGSKFVSRIEQVFGTHGISVMTRRIAEATHVERLNEPLNVSRERSVRLVRSLQQEPAKPAQTTDVDATGIQAPTPACPAGVRSQQS